MTRSSRTEWWRADVAGDDAQQPEGVAAAQPTVPRSAVPFRGLMTFTFILFLAPQTWFPALAPLRVSLLTAIVAVAAYLVDQIKHSRPITILTREMWLAAGLTVWAVVTVPLSYWPGGSVSFLLDTYLKTMAIFWLLPNIVTTLTRLHRVFWGLSLMAVPLAAAAVQAYLTGNFLLATRELRRINGYDAPLSANPNDLALLLNLVLPLTMALVMVHRKPIVRALLLVMVFLSTIGVILTFSRGGFLTLAAIVTMYLWKSAKTPGRGVAVAALVLVCIPLLPSGYVGRLSTITDAESDSTGSSQARWTDLAAAMEFVARNPIVGAGVGMNTLGLNEQRMLEGHWVRWNPVHNVYLQYAVELGVPGLVLFLLLLGGCVKRVRSIRRRCAAQPGLRDLFYLAEGIEISLVAFAIAAPFHPVAYNFYFYFIAGMAIALQTMCAAREAAVEAQPVEPIGGASELASR
jgi:probable O-glycosylation ligase (exosortase A-associated)